MKKRVKKYGILFVLFFSEWSSIVAQKIPIYKDIKDLEKAGNNWGLTLIKIATFSGAVASIFALIKVFKNIEQGDEQTAKVAGGWFLAISIFIIGLWFVKKYVYPTI